MPEARLTIVRAIGDVRVFLLSANLRRIHWSGEPSQLFNGAKPDAVGLPQGAVDSSGFGHAHLGAADKGRRICGVGVTITDETFRTASLIDDGLKNPTVSYGIG